MVLLVKLVASQEDLYGYITYVFRNLESENEFTKYIMCVRYPNWEGKLLQLGDEGYLHFEEVRAGIDKWFNGEQMIPYNYDAIQFMKFVPKPIEEDYKYVM